MFPFFLARFSFLIDKLKIFVYNTSITSLYKKDGDTSRWTVAVPVMTVTLTIRYCLNRLGIPVPKLSFEGDRVCLFCYF